MIEIFMWLVPLALIAGGFLLVRSFFKQRNMMNPPMGMPWQQAYGPEDEYGRGVYPNSGYDGPGYGRPMYGPEYRNPGYGRPMYGPGYDPNGYGRPMYGPGYPPQTGMSPWAAGGLGALGGGLLGYHMGQMAAEQEQPAQGGDLASPDQTAMLDQGSYDPGMADLGAFDAGGFSDFGGDFGGSEF